MENERQPYVGPRPFEIADRNVFFGRDREARELKARVIGHPLALLYAQSGAGKTSLINARLIPDLDEEGFNVLPATRVQSAYMTEAPRDQVKNVYSFNALRELQAFIDLNRSVNGEKGRDPVDLANETVASFLKQYPRTVDELGETKPLVLIVDQ